MPETIACPQCGRSLRLPDGLLGQLVKCPSCGHVFTATQSSPPRPAPVAAAAPQARRSAAADRPQDEDSPRPVPDHDRADEHPAAPHRGGLILALGILGLMLSCLPPVGWILGGVAMNLANTDLQEMKDGRLDRSGRSLTETGRTCGVLAVVLASVVVLLFCLIAIAQID
jgi:predicted Zn finger-like uncharacterized protein